MKAIPAAKRVQSAEANVKVANKDMEIRKFYFNLKEIIIVPGS